MKTEDELIGFVLDYHRTSGSGQAYNADEVAFVRKYVTGAVDDLNRRLGIYISGGDEFEDDQAPWIAVSIANIPPVAKFFGSDPDMVGKMMAEATLSAQNAEDTTLPVRFSSF